MIWPNILIMTDIFWAAALLAMGFFVIVLIRAHLRPSAARWFSMLICAACLNVIGVILTDLIDQDYPVGLRAICIGRAFIPFCLLGFSLVFPYRSKLSRSRPALLALALPSLVTAVVTDPQFAPGDITYQLWYHIPWMGVYFGWAYVNLVTSFRRSRLPITRRQHTLLSIAAVPSTAMHYLTSILLPALGWNFLWRYNWLPILAAFLIFLGTSVRYGVIKRRTSLSRSLLDRTIDAAGLSSQIVTHTVKDSLQTIRALAETAAMADCPDPAARIGRIITLCDDLSVRMNRLNLLARSQLSPAEDSISVRQALDRAIDRAAPRLTMMRMVTDYIEPPPVVRGDSTQLEEVFYNLLTNAAEAMPDGGELRLEIRVENDWVIVGLHDRGPGINPEQLASIFEPFRSTKGSRENWGIGLSYCHLAIQNMGGDLFAESEPGRGSSFFVVLPLLEERHPAEGRHRPTPFAALPTAVRRHG